MFERLLLLSSCFNADNLVWCKITNLAANEPICAGAAPISAGFRNRLHLAMILSRKSDCLELGENVAKEVLNYEQGAEALGIYLPKQPYCFENEYILHSQFHIY